MRYLPIVIIPSLVLFTACKKQDNSSCFLPNAIMVMVQSYSNPVWHPTGNMLGFNHTPLKPITLASDPPCTRYSYPGKYDSTGFYLMNRDKTGFKRITRFTLEAPSWSPDGKWIAYSFERNIYKMPFDGSSFDTTQPVKLTNNPSQSGSVDFNVYPVWTANSDTIYYSSSVGGPPGTGKYVIWKMASDGTGKTQITDATTAGDIRELFVGSDNRIYHTRPVNAKREVFSMNKDGSNLQQLTTATGLTNESKHFVKYWQGKVYYQANDGIYVFTQGSQPVKIIDKPVHTYDISSDGEIVYSRFTYYDNEKDERLGTLWIANTDGGSRQQLTFNRF